jgi:hypothetical protein
VALNEREEKLRKMEEQLVARERSIASREKRLQSTERQSSHPRAGGGTAGVTGGGNAAVRRAHSLPVFEIPPIEESEEEGEENRRMSLQQEDPIPLDQEEYQRNTGWVGSGPPVAPPLFRIYSDENSCPATVTGTTAAAAADKKKEDFSSGVARARELLNRPRLMTLEGGQRNRTNSSEYYPSGATGSTFYKNYLANKKANDCATAAALGVENMKPALVIPAPLPPADGLRKGLPSADNNGGCGSATKRARCDYEDGEAVPSVQVDLHSLMMAGRGR